MASIHRGSTGGKPPTYRFEFDGPLFSRFIAREAPPASVPVKTLNPNSLTFRSSACFSFSVFVLYEYFYPFLCDMALWGVYEATATTLLNASLFA
ncbi:hypothetical protein AKJ16_DCAP07191 [Drosera capensis]